MDILSEGDLQFRVSEILDRGGYRDEQDVYLVPLTAIRLNRIDLLEKIPLRDNDLLFYAVLCGNIDCVRFLIDDCKLSPQSYCYNALSGSNAIKMAKLLESKDVPKADTAIQFAAERNNMPLVQYLHNQKFPCSGYEIQGAASRGHVRMMDWLHNHGYIVSTNTRSYAEKYVQITGKSQCLEWLTEHGF